MTDVLAPDEPTNPNDPVPGGRGGNAAHTLPRTGDQGIDGLLGGVAWDSNALTYSFPDSASLYGSSEGTAAGQYPDPAPFNNFSALTTAQEADVQRAFALVSSYTKLTFTEVTESATAHAMIRLANSASPPTAYAYYPSTEITGGDVFFGGTGREPAMGNFDSGNAVLHEIGHALGLKHGQDNEQYGTVPANLLSNDYAWMNYPSYVGDTSSASGIGPGSAPQTYMMYDIAALQYAYGANFDNVGSSLVYTWSPVTGEQYINGVGQGTPFNNHIFSTVWTGGATATYDLSNFSQNGTFDLRPGGSLLFSDAQRADLGYYSADGPGAHMALGNIYNALLYNGDTRSEVSTLYTGSGDDIVYGNDLFDTIILGGGSDTVYAGSGGGRYVGGSGADTFVGGSGTDYFDLGDFSTTEMVDGGGGSNIAIFAGKVDTYDPIYNNGTVTITVKAKPGAVATLTNVQTLQFADAAVPVSALACFAAGTRVATPHGSVAVEGLQVGALVTTHAGRALPVVWVGQRSVACASHPRPEAVWPVRVAARAFGAEGPTRPLYLSPDHAVFVDGVLIPVKYLIDGTAIRQVKRRTVTYHHVELARHDVILAEGLATETFLDTGNRADFLDGGRVVTLHPAFTHWTHEAAACAPLVVTGPILEAVRQRLAVHAPGAAPVQAAAAASADGVAAGGSAEPAAGALSDRAAAGASG